MPIYEYRCESCGQELEKIQKFSDPPLKDCPACGKAALVKLVSASAFRLKGSGWYETDFKTGNRKNVAGESKQETADKGGTDSKGEKSASGADKSDKQPAKKETKSDSGSSSKGAGSAAS